MTRRLISCFAVILMLLSLCSCAVKTGESDNALALYCRSDLEQARGGDAITGVPVAWDTLPEGDRQQQAEDVHLRKLIQPGSLTCRASRL